MNQRIPPRLYSHILDENDKTVVLLEHLDYFNRASGMSSPLRRAADAVAALKEPVYALISPTVLSGVNPATAQIIQEIMTTGSSKDLMRHIQP